jgi:hypothetical protein
LATFEAGLDVADIHEQFPGVPVADIRTVLSYAAKHGKLSPLALVRVFLDNNVPAGVARIISHHSVSTSPRIRSAAATKASG